MLKLEQSERHFTNGNDSVILRVIEPSPPYGVWPGSTYQIRKWEICRSGQVLFAHCSNDEMIAFEAELGEVKNIRFIDHPTLGLVVTGEPNVRSESA